jgi:exoribonuclease II
MKALITSVLALFIFSCADSYQQNLTHTETAKIVLESFYAKDNTTLKKYTTSDGYSGLIMIQNLVPDDNKNTEVEILVEAVEDNTAWVKYNSSFDKNPGIFKLIKENGQWKVTIKGPREKGPF